MAIAPCGPTMAVDWEQRVDSPRLRRERLERTKAALNASDHGALVLYVRCYRRALGGVHVTTPRVILER
jgi:hypothetical protein